MTRTFHIAWLAIYTLLAPALFSQEPIVGAFGLKLGDVFERGGSSERTGAQVEAYTFMPKDPLFPFTEYHVTVTPKTKRIVSILARAEKLDPQAAWDFATLFEIALQNKYGAAVEESKPIADPTKPYQPGVHVRRNPADVESTKIQQGNRSIQISWSAYNKSISIYYADLDLFAESKKEEYEIGEERRTAASVAEAFRLKLQQEQAEKAQAAEAERRTKMREVLKEQAAKLDTSSL